MKQIKECLNKWKTAYVHGSRRLNIVKMTILLKVIYRFNAISCQNSNDIFFSAETEKNIPKDMQNLKRNLNTKTILEKSKSWESHTFWFQNLLESNSNWNSLVLA